jgi:hypothetical protein
MNKEKIKKKLCEFSNFCVDRYVVLKWDENRPILAKIYLFFASLCRQLENSSFLEDARIQQIWLDLYKETRSRVLAGFA